jgi:hypothetical protein
MFLRGYYTFSVMPSFFLTLRRILIIVFLVQLVGFNYGTIWDFEL